MWRLVPSRLGWLIVLWAFSKEEGQKVEKEALIFCHLILFIYCYELERKQEEANKSRIFLKEESEEEERKSLSRQRK